MTGEAILVDGGLIAAGLELSRKLRLTKSEGGKGSRSMTGTLEAFANFNRNVYGNIN